MPVNDFEKQMQQKMDELQLRPSGEVWEEVEKQIRKEKRRRRIFFWLPMLALLLGSVVSYLLINNHSDKTNANNITSGNSSTKEIGIKTKQSSAKQPVVTSQHIDTLSQQYDEGEFSTQSTDLLTETTNSSLSNKKRNITKDESVNFIVSQPQRNSAKKHIEPEKQNLADKEDKDFNTNNNPEKAEGTFNPTGNNPTGQKDNTREDTLEVADKDEKRDSLKTIVDSAVVEPGFVKQAARPKRKWNWGFEVQPGLSNTKRGDIFNSDKELYLASPNLSAGASTFGPFAPPVLIESPKANFSFALKVFAQKAIGKRWSLQTGLQYSYMSTSVKVGEEVRARQELYNSVSDGVVINQYYRSSNTGDNQSYTNQYHFAGINAGFSWKAFSIKGTTINWDNLVSVNRLLKTNALLFDNTIRGYYTDFSAFNKTQIFISSGVSLPVAVRKNVTYMTSGFVSLGVTPVLKRSTELNSHLLNYGIGLKLLFYKSK